MLLLALMPNYWNGAERRGKREELQRFKASKRVSRGKGDSRIFDLSRLWDSKVACILVFDLIQFHGLVAFLELRCSPWCHAPWLRLSIFGLLNGFVLFFWVCVSNHSLGTGANHYQVWLLSESEGCRFDSLVIPDNEEMKFISKKFSSENSLFPFILLRSGQQIGFVQDSKNSRQGPWLAPSLHWSHITRWLPTGAFTLPARLKICLYLVVGNINCDSMWAKWLYAQW